MTGKRFTAILISVFVTIGAFVGCGQNKQNTGQTSAETKTEETSETGNLEVHIGDQPSFFLLKIADNLGYFEKMAVSILLQVVM